MNRPLVPWFYQFARLSSLGLSLFFFLLSVGGADAKVLTNGGFESGMTGWSNSLSSGGVAVFSVTSTNSHNGSNALKVSVTDAGTASNSVQIVSSDFLASATNIYILRFWAWSSVPLASVGVNFLGAAPAFPQIPFEVYTNFGGGGYQEYFYAFKASGDVSVAFNFKSVSDYFLDDVEIIDLDDTESWDVPLTYLWQWGQLHYSQTNSTGWTGGDNDKSIQLPDTSVAWILNDSWVGTLNFYSNIRGSGSLPRNFIMHQVGTNMTPVSRSTIFNPGGGDVYWIGDPVVEGSNLKVLLTEQGGSSDARIGTSVATLSLPTLALTGIVEIPSLAAENYEALVDGNDGYYYVYCATNYAPYAYESYVARVPRGSLDVSAAWNFWNGSSWVADYTQAVVLPKFHNAWTMEMLGPGNFVAFADNLGVNEVQYAPSPMGPWSSQTTVFSSPGESGEYNYAGNLHKETWQNGVYTFSYSDHLAYEPSSKVTSDKSYYRPHYVQADLLSLSPYAPTNYWDNFNLDNLNLASGYALGWLPFDAGWSVVSGQLQIVCTNACKDIVKGILVTNFSYEADVSASSSGDSGLIFLGSNYGVGDNYCGYYAGINPGAGVVTLNIQNGAGVVTNLATVSQTLVASGSEPAWYHLKVTAVGGLINVYLTDMVTPVITVTNLALASGSIGVRANNTTAKFDNVLVNSGSSFSGRPNLALNQAVTASSVASAVYAATNVVDGNPGTRWLSASSDPQWITVDLGAPRQLNRVRLEWEAAYGASYQIQGSPDNVSWTTVYSLTNALGGVDDLMFSPVIARYVRMYGTQRGTSSGYSLWEFEAYGPPTLPTTNTLSASTNSAPVGTTVTLTDQVKPSPPNGESVTFLDGTTVLDVGAISSGKAVFNTSTLTPGSHALTAVYVGDANDSASTSSVVTVTITKISATANVLSASANGRYLGDLITFTNQITPAPANGESVSFMDGSTVLDGGTLSRGVATYSTSALALGSHAITAVYGGDASYLASTSSVLLVEMVLPPAAQLTSESVGAGSGTFTLNFTGASNATYSVQASTNLLHWDVIGTAAEQAPGQYQFLDSAATNWPTRYYRVSAP